jgi:thiol:disulfide interchange protein DsbD
MLTQLLVNLEEIFLSSSLNALWVSFIAGIIASLSPCTYPLIPITLGIVGAADVSSKLKGFYISSVFVLGICFTYTVLGVISSLLGIFLNNIFSNFITFLILSVILFMLGFSLIGVLPLNLPIVTPKHTKREDGLSLFIFGMVSGLAMTPCNFPVLGAILSLISLKENIIFGAVALFLFSLGYGLILIILGTFTSLIRKLPKQGYWLIIIKRISGIILIMVGGYFFLKFLMLLAR